MGMEAKREERGNKGVLDEGSVSRTNKRGRGKSSDTVQQYDDGQAGTNARKKNYRSRRIVVAPDMGGLCHSIGLGGDSTASLQEAQVATNNLVEDTGTFTTTIPSQTRPQQWRTKRRISRRQRLLGMTAYFGASTLQTDEAGDCARQDVLIRAATTPPLMES